MGIRERRKRFNVYDPTDGQLDKRDNPGGRTTVEGPPESDTTVNVTAGGNVTVTVAYYDETPHP